MSAMARPRRADALRNCERVTAAAAALFAEKGLDASVDEVAARAGVGKATVYRSFPTKEHLVAAVACVRLRWYEELTIAAAEADEAWPAFVEFLRTAAEAQRGNRLLTVSLAGASEDPDVSAAKAGLIAAFDRLVARGRAEGTMRADATPRDVQVLLSGVTRVLNEEGERDPAAWRRCADLVADAMRA